MLNKKFQSYDSIRTYIVKILLTLFFAFVVVCPLVRMLCYLFQTDIKSVIFNEQFKTALLNSFVSTVVSSVISVGLAIILSYCIFRTQIKHKTIFSVLLTLPMLIPSVSHGMGLILLFGSNGFITNMFKFNTSVYGF
jgi:iron(III) transport system permease protein